MSSELTLALEQELQKIPTIDIHSRVDPDEPCADDGAAAVLSEDVKADLIAAGMPEDDLDEDVPSSERVRRALPYLRMIRNTAAYWCARQIASDLYACEDIDDSLGEKRPLDAAQVLEKANVERVITRANWWHSIPDGGDLPFSPLLRLDSLINEPHLSKTMDRLAEASGESIYEAADARKAIKALIGKAAKSGCRALSASFNPRVTFERGSREAADRVLSLTMLGQKTNPDDWKALRSYVMASVLEAAGEQGLTFQLILGLVRPMPGDKTLSAFDPEMLTNYAEVFNQYGSVSFDVFLASSVQLHELAVLARNYSNVYASGCWSYASYPLHIERVFRERIEMLPMSRSCAFLSDAGNVEWVYARAKLVRKALARTLAQMIEEGLLSEDAALDVSRHYLRENAARLYSAVRKSDIL